MEGELLVGDGIHHGVVRFASVECLSHIVCLADTHGSVDNVVRRRGGLGGGTEAVGTWYNCTFDPNFLYHISCIYGNC